MKVKADLHIHTVLSPCADLEMSPAKIVKKAQEKGLGIIGITDHNSTLQCATVRKVAEKLGIFVLMGAEVTSKEEAHCLTFFETEETLNEFQDFLNNNQPKIHNDPQKFGFQVVVDENENIINQIDHYLGVALNAGIEEIEERVHKLGGLFIPAHINRARYSLISQLGFVPKDIMADALEIFNRSSLEDFLKENSYLKRFSFIKNSDSHYLDNVGMFTSTFNIEEATFKEIKMALSSKDGRSVLIE